MDLQTMEAIKGMLRNREWDEALACLFKKINAITDDLKNLPNEKSDMITEFNEIMVFIEQAVKCQDVILLNDMLEYELYPFAQRNSKVKDGFNG